MSLLTESYVRELANKHIIQSAERYGIYETRDSICKSLLTESRVNFSDGKNYDIFLSHSYLDKELVLGIKIELESFGFSVYVDWEEDPQLNRSNVTPENVSWIKKRMKSSSCLIYTVTDNSSTSKWMPWELGFMDGYTNKVAVLPIINNSKGFIGHEYLNIYPYIDKVPDTKTKKQLLWVTDRKDSNKYAKLKTWIGDGKLLSH